jgi:MYND finger
MEFSEQTKAAFDQSLPMTARGPAWTWLAAMLLGETKMILSDGTEQSTSDVAARAFALSGGLSHIFEFMNEAMHAAFPGVDEESKFVDGGWVVTSSLGSPIPRITIATAVFCNLGRCSRGAKTLAQACPDGFVAAAGKFIDRHANACIADARVSTISFVMLCNGTVATVMAVLLKGSWAKVAALVERGLVSFILQVQLSERTWRLYDKHITSGTQGEPSKAEDLRTQFFEGIVSAELLALRAHQRLAADPQCAVARRAIAELRAAPVLPRVLESVLYRDVWRVNGDAFIYAVSVLCDGAFFFGGWQQLSERPLLAADFITMMSSFSSPDAPSLATERALSNVDMSRWREALDNVLTGCASTRPVTEEAVQAQLAFRRERLLDDPLPSCDQCLARLGREAESHLPQPMRCSRCHLAVYCSVKCQRLAWKAHKRMCV